MKVKISEIALVTIIIIQGCCKGLDAVPKKSDQQQLERNDSGLQSLNNDPPFIADKRQIDTVQINKPRGEKGSLIENTKRSLAVSEKNSSTNVLFDVGSCTDSEELIWIDKTFKKQNCAFIASNAETYCTRDRISEACPVACNSCPCVDSERAFKLPVGYKKCSFVGTSKEGYCSWPNIKTICPETCGLCTATPSCADKSGRIWINSEHKRQDCSFVAANSDEFCSWLFVRKHCPVTCDACPCVDSIGLIYVNAAIGRKTCDDMIDIGMEYCNFPRVREFCPNTCRVCELPGCNDAIGDFTISGKERSCKETYNMKVPWLCNSFDIYEKLCPRACGVCVPECVDSTAPFPFRGGESTCDTIPMWGCNQDWIKRLCRAKCTKCDSPEPTSAPSQNPSFAPTKSLAPTSEPSLEPSFLPTSSPTKFVPDLDAIYSIDIDVEYLCGNKTTGELFPEQKLILENAILNVTSEYNNETEVSVSAANLINFEQAECCVSDDCLSHIFYNRRHLQRRRLRTPIKFLVPVKCFSKTSCPDEILPVGDRRRLSEMLSRKLSIFNIARQFSSLISFNTIFLEYLRSENALETINNTLAIDENITEVDECIVGNDSCDIETTCCGVNDDCYCAISSASYCTLNRCELTGQDCCVYGECYGSEACAPTSSPTNYPTTTHGPVMVKYYKGTWRKLPNFSTLVPYKIDYLEDINFNAGKGFFATSGLKEYFGAVFEGHVRFPFPGRWTLYTRSDDGSELFVDGVLVVANDGVHAAQTRSGTIDISFQGEIKDVTVLFFERKILASLIVLWKGPSTPIGPIPPNAWLRI